MPSPPILLPSTNNKHRPAFFHAGRCGGVVSTNHLTHSSENFAQIAFSFFSLYSRSPSPVQRAKVRRKVLATSQPRRKTIVDVAEEASVGCGVYFTSPKDLQSIFL